MNRRVLSGYLSGWGIDVHVSESGADALEPARTASAAGTPFGVVVSDMCMPGMSGLELARALAADPATTASLIVLLSTSGD